MPVARVSWNVIALRVGSRIANSSARSTPAKARQRRSCRESFGSFPRMATTGPCPPASSCIARSRGRSSGSIGMRRAASLFVDFTSPVSRLAPGAQRILFYLFPTASEFHWSGQHLRPCDAGDTTQAPPVLVLRRANTSRRLRSRPSETENGGSERDARRVNLWLTRFRLHPGGSGR
jgi:hypothetical protein